MSDRDLWCAVLELAVNDALFGVPMSVLTHGDGKASRAVFIHAAKSAREFVTKPSKDLEHLCGLTGIDCASFIDRMRKRLLDAPKVEELADMTPTQRGAISPSKKAPRLHTRKSRAAVAEETAVR